MVVLTAKTLVPDFPNQVNVFFDAALIIVKNGEVWDQGLGRQNGDGVIHHRAAVIM
jgi:hypothetical protein